MNQTHLHLILNHVAILGAVFSLMLLVSGSLFGQVVLRKAALVGFVVAALAAVPVFLTGEAAEEAVEHQAGISEQVIHEHEEAGEAAIWIMVGTGLVALLVLIFGIDKDQKGARLMWVVYLLAIASAVAMINTGLKGGKIRHTEISGSTSSPAAPAVDGEHDED
jgi:formate hydrogenlyase subunit 3/multisubunit Na+/H+ antiporter MnhD subunit